MQSARGTVWRRECCVRGCHVCRRVKFHVEAKKPKIVPWQKVPAMWYVSAKCSSFKAALALAGVPLRAEDVWEKAESYVRAR